MLILAIGDFFIPDRAINLPYKFRKLLNPSYGNTSKTLQPPPAHAKIGKVLCLGNITNSNETLKFLHGLSPSFQIVRGEFDDPTILSQQLYNLGEGGKNKSKPSGGAAAGAIPLYSTVSVEGLRIGFTNGYQVLPRNDPLSLSAFAREVDVDIVIWGGTHEVEAYTLDGKFFVNPGSATGAYGFDWPEGDDDDDDDDGEEDEDLEKVNEDNIDENAGSDEKKDANKQEQDKKESEAGDKVTDEDNTTTETSEQKQKDDDKETSTDSRTEKEPENTKSDNATTEGEELEKDPNSLSDNSVELSESDINKLVEMKTSIPSFCLLDIQGTTCTLYIYTYLNDEIKVDKVTFQKEIK